jgi:hypothetical protein
MLGLIRYVAFCSSPDDNPMILYPALVRSKIEHGSVLWNSLHSLILLNAKEFKDNFQSYAIVDFLLALGKGKVVRALN